jgi:hypothetical protein
VQLYLPAEPADEGQKGPMSHRTRVKLLLCPALWALVIAGEVWLTWPGKAWPRAALHKGMTLNEVRSAIGEEGLDNPIGYPTDCWTIDLTGRPDWLGNRTQYRLFFIYDAEGQWRLFDWREEPVESPHIPVFEEIVTWF